MISDPKKLAGKMLEEIAEGVEVDAE